MQGDRVEYGRARKDRQNYTKAVEKSERVFEVNRMINYREGCRTARRKRRDMAMSGSISGRGLPRGQEHLKRACEQNRACCGRIRGSGSVDPGDIPQNNRIMLLERRL